MQKKRKRDEDSHHTCRHQKAAAPTTPGNSSPEGHIEYTYVGSDTEQSSDGTNVSKSQVSQRRLLPPKYPGKLTRQVQELGSTHEAAKTNI